MTSRALPRARQVPFSGDRTNPGRPGLFRSWLDRREPDVVLNFDSVVRGQPKEAGRRKPEGAGVIQLGWRASRRGIAGMNQRNRVAGEAAVVTVVGQTRNGQSGAQEFPLATLIGRSGRTEQRGGSGRGLAVRAGL